MEAVVELCSSMWTVMQWTSWNLETIKRLSPVLLSICSSSLSPTRPLRLLDQRRTLWILLRAISTGTTTAVASLIATPLSLWIPRLRLESIASAAIVIISSLLFVLVVNRHQRPWYLFLRRRLLCLLWTLLWLRLLRCFLNRLHDGFFLLLCLLSLLNSLRHCRLWLL